MRLFTRSGHDVQGRASPPVAWRNGAEKVPDVWLRCCHGCCQPRHDRCRLLASQLAKDVRFHAASLPPASATSLPERLPRPHPGYLVHRLYRVGAPPNTGYGQGTENSPLRSFPLRAPQVLLVEATPCSQGGSTCIFVLRLRRVSDFSRR